MTQVECAILEKYNKFPVEAGFTTADVKRALDGYNDSLLKFYYTHLIMLQKKHDNSTISYYILELLRRLNHINGLEKN